MPVPKLFIASSNHAKRLVEEFIKALDASKVEPIPWYNSFDLGENTLNTLIDKSEACDYLAVFLTPDDKSEKKGEPLDVPRDNCIFELGLFLGALDRNPKRCFMVTSLSQEHALPSDLAGRTYVQISEEAEKRETSMRAAAELILKQISDIGPRAPSRSIPFITGQELMAREKPKGIGGDLVIEQGLAVVVNSAQPIESNYHVAGMVLKNMQGGVKYEYFFEGDQRNSEFICNFVQTLAIAGLEEKAPETPDQRKQITQERQSQVSANLNTLRKYLNIHFRQSPTLQFCVHNANRDSNAVCYLSYHGNGFLKWISNREAVDVARELTQSCATQRKQSYVFHSTKDYPLAKKNALRRELDELLHDRFSEPIHKQLRDVCFESSGRK